MKETALRNQCLEYLGRIGIVAWKNNSGALENSKGNFIRFGQPGSPDILGIIPPDGRMLCIENKVGKNSLSKDQANWLLAAYDAGAHVNMITSLDQLQQWVEAGYTGHEEYLKKEIIRGLNRKPRLKLSGGWKRVKRK